MLYPPEITEPCRKDLTTAGFTELKTPSDVDMAVRNAPGTTLVVVNSVCGCAAGMARPGVKLAVQHEKVPDRIATVFAGVDTVHRTLQGWTARVHDGTLADRRPRTAGNRL